MSKLIISSDSTCAISRADAEKIGLPILPLNVIVDGKEFHDGIDINNDQLTVFMRNGALIKTSTPTPVEIQQFFDKIFAAGYEQVIHFTISSKLSSMFDLFTITCRDLYGDKVTVIDSLSICSYMGNNVLSAMELVKQGKTREQIVESAKKRIGTETIFFIPESLTFLKRGGRVSPAVAALGNFINLKPILAFKNGAIEKSGMTRNLKRAITDELLKIKKHKFSNDNYEIFVVTIDTAPAILEITRKAIEKVLPNYDVHVTPISINVAAHAGPGTIGVGICKKVNAD